MSTTATKLTADEYYAITVEGDRKQLVEGEIVVNQPKGIHAVLQERLTFALGAWVRAGDARGLVMLPTDVRLDERNVYGPDLLWFRAGREPKEFDAYPEELPDLCVEIRSASTWRHDIGAKKGVYERSGLPELWLVDDKAETVLVYRRSSPDTASFDVALEPGRGEALTSPLLPGFSLALDELFER
jgi:Uma2 family endonuclease